MMGRVQIITSCSQRDAVVFNLFGLLWLDDPDVQILSIQSRPKWGAFEFFPCMGGGMSSFECFLGTLHPTMDGIRLFPICLLSDRV